MSVDTGRGSEEVSSQPFPPMPMQVLILPPEVVLAIADLVYDLWRRELRLAHERTGQALFERSAW